MPDTNDGSHAQGSPLLSGRYRLERELGRGGMAVVHLARDLKHDRPVAVKVLRPELTASIGAERFLREIGIVAKLAHPHVLPLYDSGEDRAQIFYVMPFVEGESLRERLIRETQLPLADVVRITREVAGGLGYAHGLGVVHRDIKPENILLSAGHGIIADFGIARAVSEAGGDDLTGTGIAIGTPDYMSPEQAGGDARVDARTDIYALGCVLYEMLTGEPPFRAATVQATLARHSMAPVPRIHTVRNTVPPEIDEVVACALAKVPADRFASAAEFAEALDGAVAQHTGSAISVAVPAAPRTSSIAVLPFLNMSGDPDNEFLSDGITEEIIQTLAKVDGIHVVARTSAFVFKNTQADIRSIGEALNVATILEGSVRRAGNRIRVNAQLINAQDGFEVWTDRYQRQLDDVFELQDDIAKAIVEALHVKLLDERPLASSGTSNFEAYELYLRGRYLWNKRTDHDLQRSVELMLGALAKDANFPLAHSGLADAYTIMGIYGLRPPGEVMPLAEEAADRALQIEPRNPEALTSRACVKGMYHWAWSEAERDFNDSIAHNPKYATAHQWYAVHCLAPQGRFVDAHNALRRARELDPLSAVVHASRGVVYYYERKYERALAEYQRVFDIDPTFGLAHYFAGLAYERTAHYEEALAAFQQAVQHSGNTPETIAAVGHVHAVSGNRSAADERLAELTALSQQRYVSPVLIALIYTGLGDTASAIDWLQKGLGLRATEMAWLGVRPVFDPLRPHPEFRSLLETVRLLPVAAHDTP